jgi:predicted TIM-barrel enzyme
MTNPKTAAVLERFEAVRSARRALVVAGVGSGITARGAASGGADAVAVYNTAVYRIMGLPTALAFLPYDDCNAVTLDAAPEVIAAAGSTPVIIGFGAHDQRRSLDHLVDAAELIGAAGVTNEPFLGMYDAALAAPLVAAGLGFDRERELVRRAVERGLVGFGWAFSPDEASSMVDAGASIVGAMLREVTTAADTPPNDADLRRALEPAARQLREIVARVRRESRSAFVLIHGGPLSDPTSVEVALELTGADGYVTGSTGERQPVERAVANAIRSFKALATNSAVGYVEEPNP